MRTNKTYRKYKSAIIPSVFIVVFILLSIGVVNFFWQKIALTRDKINVNQSQKNILDDRLSTLQGAILEAQESKNLLAFALPETSPAILILSHLNRLTSEYEIRLDALTVNQRESGIEEDVMRNLTINFDLYGDYTQIFSFISDLANITPLVNVDALEIESGQSEGYLARVRLIGYYSAFPTELPPITSPLEDFTDEEKSVINFLQQFERPVFEEQSGQVEENNNPKGKDNPFEVIN